MKNNFSLFLFSVLVLTAKLLVAQENAQELWDSAPPHSIINDIYKEEIRYDSNGEIRSIGQISSPKIEVFKPSANSNGIGVLVLPGGGYQYVAITKEGYKIAERLNKLGYTVFVLSYRMPSDLIMKNKSVGPLMDAQEAMRRIRSQALDYGVDPDNIGVLGFSAGGHLAATLHTQYNRDIYTSTYQVSAKPDFAILIYPVISMDSTITHQGSREKLLGLNPTNEQVDAFSNELHINSETSPAFLVHATDDGSVSVENSLRYYNSLLKNKVPAAMHIYQSGGHGFGLGRNPENSRWIEDLDRWLQYRKK